MTTVRETTSFDDKELRGHGHPVVLTPRRRRRPGTIALGLALVLLAALGGAMRSGSGDDLVVAVMTARPLSPGEELTAEHLVAVEIVPAIGLDWTAVDSQGDLLGLSARGPVEAGRLAVRSMFDDRVGTVGPGRIVIPAAIGVGGVPPSLRVGDRVRLHGFRFPMPIGTADVGAITSGSEPSGPGSSDLGTATVWSIRHGEGTLPSLVELLVDDDREQVVTAAAADGTLRLNLVGG